ncbi:hypothetical protein D3C85_955250 [compost metagenome]
MHGVGELAFFRVGFISAAEHIRVDHRRTHGVDPDFLLGIFDGRRLGQADHRMFRGCVDAHFRRRPKAGHRCRIDDRTAPLRQQQRQLVFHAQPDTFDVDAHDRVELVERTFGQLALLDFDAGIVEGIVEATVSIDHLLHQIFYIAFQGNVAAHEGRFATGGTNQRHRALAACHVHIGHYYLQALGGKCLGGRAANTGRPACHHDHLAGKRHAHFVMSSKRRMRGIA